MKSDWLDTIMTLLILLAAVTAGFCVHFWVGIFISITILVWGLVVVPSKNKKIMAIKRIENLKRLSELFKQQSDIERLKSVVKKESSIVFSLTMFIDGKMGSANGIILSPEQTLDVLNSLSSASEKGIHELKPIMEQLSNKE